MRKSKSNENIEFKSKSLSLISEIKTNHDNNHDITFSIGLSDISECSKNKEESNGTLENQNNLINSIINNDYTISLGGIENIEKMDLDENKNEKNKLKMEMEKENSSKVQTRMKESLTEEGESKLLKNESINSSENNNTIKEVSNKSDDDDEEKMLSEYNIEDLDKKIAKHLKAAENLKKIRRQIIQKKLNKNGE